jgi:glutaredoxin
MKKITPVLILAIGVLLLLPVGYNGLRSVLLNSGFGWTATEWTYYALLIVLGIALAFIAARLVARSAAWKRVVVCALTAVLPFAIGFVQHPIYEDLLWNLSQDMTNVEATVDYNNADLVVIAIADCPYCKRAVTEMKALHERNPELRMRMVVCTADSTWLEPYVAEAKGAFNVVMADNMDVMATHAGGHFPAYVQVSEGKPVSRWTNNEWGPVAKDAVEKGEGRGTRDEVR